MRPKSLVWFDRFYLGSMALGVVGVFVALPVTRQMLAASPATAGFGDGFIFATSFGGMAISLLLWYFISRRASNVAKWILVVLLALGLIGLPNNLRMMTQFSSLVPLFGVVNTLLQFAAVIFLFRPDARRWFAAKGQAVDPDVFS